MSAKPGLHLFIEYRCYSVVTSLTQFTLTNGFGQRITVGLDGKCSACSPWAECPHRRRLAEVGLLPSRFIPGDG